MTPALAVQDHSLTLLIIDDTPANIGVLVESMEARGFRVVVAQDGEEGVQRADFVQPDLILLDVMMPGMDGFETCRRLKASASTRNIPVIFMTSLTETEDKVAGFAVGGVDYVTKPLQIDEVIARVGTHLSLRAMQQQLERQNARLQQEIAERGQAEEALKRQRAFLRQVIDINPHFIFAKDRDGRFTLVNQALADAAQTTVEALIGQTDQGAVAADSPNADAFRRDDLEVMRTLREKVIPEEEHTAPDGRVRLFYTIKRPIVDESGQATHVLGVATDITERRKVERELEVYRQGLEQQVSARTAELTEANLRLQREIAVRARAQEEIHLLNTQLEQRVVERTAQLTAINQDLEAFNYSVSHDLRAPLRGIISYSQILREDYRDALDDTGRQYLEVMHERAQRMTLLIDDIAKLFRLTRQEMDWVKVDLGELARGIVAELAQSQPERRVEVVIAPRLESGADARLMRIALENLLGNAWKYTGKTAAARIEFGTLQRNGEMVLFVRDNGVGFDMAYAGKLFVAFQRLHSDFEGSGIGLAIVKRVIDRHGGRIWIESAIGQGTTAYFVLGQPAH
jgi:PAS domain S-box-containing protein